jgi:phospholipase C
MSSRDFLAKLSGAGGAAFLMDWAAPVIEKAYGAGPCSGHLADIQHIVLLMQENRSFDHYFGTLSSTRGFQDPGATVWEKTALIVIYDENGGFFDHVVPPTSPVGTPGEWVPNSLDINKVSGSSGNAKTKTDRSTYSRGLMVHDTFDHTSQLKLIRTRFGVPVQPDGLAGQRGRRYDLDV